MQLVIAEKPSVARDIARVLGVRPSGATAFEGSGYVITWCIGHLAELEEPAAYDPRWKLWRLETLPMIPPRFKLRPTTQAPAQLRALRALLRDRRFAEVVNACDAGREGELIFRYVYEIAGARLPVRRLWVSSLTDEALRRGFASLRPGSHYDALADAARCRAEADWLVGMNATRAVTTRQRRGERGALFSIGRVQTPTLALIVERDRAIERFVPQKYWEVRSRFETAGGAHFEAIFSHARRSRLATRELADVLLARLEPRANASAADGPVVEKLDTRPQREPPPALFDLTSLQRTANRRFGFSAARTLEIAQSLYETHKVLSYPRTDSRHLSTDVARELPKLFAALESLPPYAGFASALRHAPPALSRRVVDDSKVSDHHAIVPTSKSARLDALASDEQQIFDLVARRFLGAFFPDAEFDLTEVIVRVGALPAAATEPTAATEAQHTPRDPRAADDEDRARPLEALPAPPDRFRARGRVRRVAGWQQVADLDGAAARSSGNDSTEPETTVLPPLRLGERLDGRFATLAKQTTPPARFTEATLLAAMESAGRRIDDEALREAMRDCGLGTPATRAAVVETLLKRGYIARDKKQLRASPAGGALINALPLASLASPELTGQWEARLARIARRQDDRHAFMADIAGYVAQLVEAARDAAVAPVRPVATSVEPVGRCPRCQHAVIETARGFACSAPAKPCGFAIPKLIAHRAISPALASVILGRGRTQTLKGFRSRAGKHFAAALVLAADGTLAFDFGAGPARPEPRPASVPSRAAEASAANGTRVTPPGTAAARRLAPALDPAELKCARCGGLGLIAGKRGWGCARWREGCGFVVWYDAAGKAITPVLLRELLDKGRTRKGLWRPGNGPPVRGRLVLDAHAPDGAARFVADEPAGQGEPAEASPPVRPARARRSA